MGKVVKISVKFILGDLILNSEPEAMAIKCRKTGRSFEMSLKIFWSKDQAKMSVREYSGRETYSYSRSLR